MKLKAEKRFDFRRVSFDGVAMRSLSYPKCLVTFDMANIV